MACDYYGPGGCPYPPMVVSFAEVTCPVPEDFYEWEKLTQSPVGWFPTGCTPGVEPGVVHWEGKDYPYEKCIPTFVLSRVSWDAWEAKKKECAGTGDPVNLPREPIPIIIPTVAEAVAGGLVKLADVNPDFLTPEIIDSAPSSSVSVTPEGTGSISLGPLLLGALVLGFLSLKVIKK